MLHCQISHVGSAFLRCGELRLAMREDCDSKDGDNDNNTEDKG